MARGDLRQIANDTLLYVAEGKYPDIDGEEHDITALVKRMVDDTVLYPPNSAQLSHFQPEKRFETEILVELESTVAGIFALGGNCAALNFASGRNPGGGFLNGAQAQEESLARSSALYVSLTTRHAEGYYTENRAEKTGFYTHNIIYTPFCPLIRNDEGMLTPPLTPAFITAPAVNAGVARKHGAKEEKIKAVLEERARRVLKIAALHGHENLVLGSWGTGNLSLFG